MKNIVIIGGSFDPIHNGHIYLAKEACKHLNADKCYFLLAKNARWKEHSVDVKHRLKMLKLALKGQNQFKISKIEINSKEKENYTYNSILKFGHFKTNKYYYIIGADQLNQLHKWHEIDKLSNLVTFVVFNRAGHNLNQDNIKKYNVKYIESEEIDISSTEIRYLHELNAPRLALDYIKKHELYYVSILKNYINLKRLAHSFSVAEVAYDIALSNNLNPYTAYLAGLLHDIAKGISQEETINLMKEYYPEYVNKIGKWAYHQFLGERIAREVFKIDDHEILEAIKYHATGKDNMSTYGKIIYAADKIDPLRGWDSSSLIKLCLKDYNLGFKQVLNDNIEYFKNNNISYKNELTNNCIKYYLEGVE